MYKHMILWMIPWLFLSACIGGKSHTRLWLARTDSLLEAQPDSALHLLQVMPLRDLTDPDDRMYYALLLAQAKYKNYLPLEGDSLLLALASHYATQGNTALQARACYALGCIYSERKNYGNAYKAYHEAAHLARRAGDNRTLGQIYNNLAYICLNQGMPEQADSLYREIEVLARQTGDSLRLAEALLRRGGQALALGKDHYAEAERLIGQGAGMARLLHSPGCLHLAYVSLYALYNYAGQDEKAWEVAQEYRRVADSANYARANLLLANSYIGLSQYDSAATCLQEALSAGNDEIRLNAYDLLIELSERKADFKQAMHWQDEKDRNRQIQDKHRQEKQAAIAAKEVEFQEIGRLHAAKMKSTLYYTLGGLLGLVLVALVWRLHRRHASKMGIKESEEPGLPSLHPDGWEEGMEADRQEPWDFAAFAAKVRQAETYGRWMFLLDQHEKTGEYSPVRDSRQWQEFLQEAEALLPGHQEALCRKYPALTIRDLFCCYLYMLDFSDEQVGVLIGRERTSVYRMRRTLLKDKMGATVLTREELVNRCQDTTALRQH